MAAGNTPEKFDAWAATAASYASTIGLFSTAPASRLVVLACDLLPIGPSASRVLDVGTGSGVIPLAIVSHAPSVEVLATDFSASMLAVVDDYGLPNVRTMVADARKLAYDLREEKHLFSHVFCQFMLQTITNPLDALGQMCEVLEPGGVLGIGLWGLEHDEYAIWEQAIQEIDPTYKCPPPFDDEKAWRTPSELEEAMARVGLRNIKTEVMKLRFPTESATEFADFWFTTTNPGATKMRDSWGGDLTQARKMVEMVARERYEDGKNIWLLAVVGVGKKEKS